MKALGVIVMVIGGLALFVDFLVGVLVLAVGGILVAVARPSASRDPEGYDHPHAGKHGAMDMRKLSTKRRSRRRKD